MKYNFKTDNYKTFEKFADNILVPKSYFIPFKSIEELFNTDIRNERYSSSMVDCLSGQWDFAYFENCKDIDREIDINDIAFDKVNVPSTWQHTGYENPYYLNSRYTFNPNPPYFPEDCSAGIYRKKIHIDDLSLNYTICFLGVAGSLDLFCNGKYVGYSEGSHNSALFELNDFLVNGENELVVLNHKWSNGTYLECQDMFRCNGIFRDVLLYKTADNSIYDFEVRTDFISNEKYSLELIPSLKLTDECQLSAALYDDGQLVASKSVNVSPKGIESIKFDGLDVCEWSAEIPYLYDLVITLSKGEEVCEVIRKNVGFKHIEIKGNVFLFNNKKIKLLGVNHHDTNPKTGYVMTIDEMERDIRLVKEYNSNCIRTSHYPPDPVFLDLCDEYGIYVVDEADIETHGCETELRKPGVCSHNSKWKNHYWDRVYRMFERDKNHPCITMWSLGNESHGYSNQDYCYNELKKRTAIPVHYEGVCRTKRWAYDVISQMYTFHNVVEMIAKGKGLPRKYYKKPFYLCEYAHAMGVGAGELERYVKAFYSADNLMGGCIWEFADHAVYHENGDYEYTYGGDHGEEKHDGNFCVDGLFYPDRTPHSGAYQMKACYRPVRAYKISDGKYEFENHNYFADAVCTVKYNFLVDGISKDSGEFSLNIPPQEKQKITLSNIKAQRDKNCVVIFEYYNNDFLVAKEQIALSGGKLEFKKPQNAGKIKAAQSENKLFVYFENGSLIFDKSTGFIQSYEVNGREHINQCPLSDFKGFGIQLYRAPLDNDRNINQKWIKQRLDSQINLTKGNGYKVNENSVELYSTIISKSPKSYRNAKVKAKYTVFANGEIKADFECVSSNLNVMLPRFGVQLEMPECFDNVKYFGLGDMVNLPDFKEHAVSGIYNCKVSDMSESYIKPQESAVRCDVRFAEITDDNGCGLRFEAIKKPFALSVNHFTPQQCAKACHREDLLDMPTTCVNIDGKILGAGSNSCGPLTSNQYRVGNPKGEKISFVIKPIGD
ncbi:MAG: glycoside hydrolase family 2 TIM barrel-domain containing protein [Eubacteriales bacterium]|nr:glycoside hydrolase family 2 TIM barrel-domain containing protein [Eubacteriales bacterium]